MNSSTVRLRLVLVMLAWLAQAFSPVVHATAMAGSQGGNHNWCGDPVSAAAAWAVLPPELRAALDESAATAEQLANCALLCAAGIATPPPVEIAPSVALRAAGLEPLLPSLSSPPTRSQAPPPPAHAPPAHG